MKIFLKIQLKHFHVLSFFHCAKFKKNCWSRSRVYENVPFSGPKWPICPEQNFFGTYHYHYFFGKNYSYYFHLPTGPFHCVKFLKNSSKGPGVIRMHHFWAQNGPFPQMRFFSENPLISLVPFIHAYLHTKNQCQISIYWWNIVD